MRRFPIHPKILLSLFLLFLLVVICRTLKPRLLEYASAELYQMTYQSANDVIADTLKDFGDLVRIERNELGEVVALKTSAPQLNTLKTKTVSNLISELRRECHRKIEIPLGSMTGSLFLAGYGPKFNLTILPVSRVEAEYRNEFSDAGINQTIHKLVMRLKIHTGILLASKTMSETIEIDLCLAETVLIGKTPQFFAGIE